MPRGTLTSTARLSVVGAAARSAIVLLLLLGYRYVFFSVYARIGSTAFMLALIPCIVAGALLGISSAMVTVVANLIIDRTLALKLGIDTHTGLHALVVSVLVKLLLGVGAAVIVRSAGRLRVTNARLVDEARRRQKSEALLAESERRYRALVESLGEGVGLFDAADECVVANPAMAKALDKALDQIVGVEFARHFDDESRERIARIYVEKSTSPRCYEVVPNDRAKTVLLVTETRFEDETSDPNTKRTLRVVRDMTFRIESERKQRELERQLQRGQALQSLAVLAGGVAHDFNNLLSGIVGNAEYALRRVPRGAPLELTQCIEEIRDFSQEASQLSRQMLAYAGRRSLAVGAVDVNAEVEEALKLLRSTIEAQAVLRTELGADLPQVKADRLQLRQVVTNLVVNALEAMSPERGTITIRTGSKAIDATGLVEMSAPEGLLAGPYVIISVSDTGVGIPPELRERIFEPFFSTKSPGRGMGLAACVGIVRSHRGWLDVVSDVGKGTTFSALLPTAQGSKPPIRRLTPRDLKPPRAGSILLIDDEVAVRVVTNRLLSDLGQRVMTADCGQRGLELYRQHSATIDLVLLDLTMPELSGAEVLDELRRIRQDVQVVVTSGFHPSNASDLLNLPNVVGFLEKPHTLANLEAIVSSMFSN